MAYVEGHPEEKAVKNMIKHGGFITIITLTLLGMLIVGSNDWMGELYRNLAVVGVVLFVSIIVSLKLNPLGWKRVFKKAEYERLLRNEKLVINELSKLDDNYFVINDFSFELFHVEHLVVSDKGMFVVAKNPYAGELNVANGALYSDDQSLESVTSSLWRVCHLINIIIRKGFNNLEIMPKPVLVLPNESKSSMKDFEGIAVTGIDELNGLITSRIRFNIDREHAEGFAVFIKQRYLH
jgi:hypothetical protein